MRRVSLALMRFSPSNLNDLQPFPDLKEHLDAVVLGEVIEHILNWPLGLIQTLVDRLHQGGALLVTTPNSCTVANPMRMLTGNRLRCGIAETLQETRILDSAL